MTGADTPPDANDDRPLIVPWIQALTIISAVALAAFDLTQPETQVPILVYAIVGGVALGVNPNFRDLFRN